MKNLRAILAWTGRLIAKDSFAAFALCGMLVLAQYHVNDASRLAADCERSRADMLMLRLDRIEAMLIHNEAVGNSMRLQLLTHDKGLPPWQPVDGPEAKNARRSEDDYQRIRKDFEAKLPHWEKTCEDIDNFKDQNVLFMAAIGAMLTFLGFRLGKNSERKASKPRKK